MTEVKHKRLSRRDAIKLLGAAAGAAALANLPSKWSKPELVSGVLPAHAQTSSLGLQILSCTFNLDWSGSSLIWDGNLTVGPLPIPNIPIEMKYTITFVDTHFQSGSDPQSPNPYIGNLPLDNATGTVLNFNSSNAVLPGLMQGDSGKGNGTVTVLWEFLNPLHGSLSCSRTRGWS